MGIIILKSMILALCSLVFDKVCLFSYRLYSGTHGHSHQPLGTLAASIEKKHCVSFSIKGDKRKTRKNAFQHIFLLLYFFRAVAFVAGKHIDHNEQHCDMDSL